MIFWLKKEDSIQFDFNKLIPQPKGLDIISSYPFEYEALIAYIRTLPSYEEHLKACKILEDSLDIFDYGRLLKISHQLTSEDIKKSNERYSSFIEECGCKNLMEVGKLYYDNILRTGSINWYMWNVKNWGTKWNACDCNVEKPNLNNGMKYIIKFRTAWDIPREIIKIMALKYGVNSFAWECMYETEYYEYLDLCDDAKDKEKISDMPYRLLVLTEDKSKNIEINVGELLW